MATLYMCQLDIDEKTNDNFFFFLIVLIKMRRLCDYVIVN